MKIPVGILGATGIVGQQYLKMLDNHPWFEVTYLAASEASSGKTFKEATLGRFFLQNDLSDKILNQIIHKVSDKSEDLTKALNSCQFVFSALETDAARRFEEGYAKWGLPVISNASAFRNCPDVPMLIPEINAHHLDAIAFQKKIRGFDKGFIVVKPNCSLQSYLCPLYAIMQAFPIKKVIVNTMQAISGAGWPGVSSLDILDNIIPHIAGEEEKSENEPLKILGSIENESIKNADDLIFSAHCNRVPVIDGHMACVSVEFKDLIPSVEEVISLWDTFTGPPQKLNLPSAPLKPILYRHEPNRPQTKLDRDNDKQMCTTVGRLRHCQAMHLKFVGLSHNTVRGAAGGGILNAEILKALHYL
jgi:aspartate-semialdehyde dehydrogenase